MEYTERAIIQRLKEGDKVVFEWLFKEYYTSLCIYAYRFTGEQAMSEELVSSTFAAIWEKRKEINFDTSIRSYLFRTVHNKGLNHLKHLKTRKKYENYLLDHLPSWTEGVIAEQLQTGGDLRQDIEKALQSLPDRCREIFLLSRFGGKKYHEIATLLNISPKTVETQMSIALRKLRHNLRHWIPLFIVLHHFT